MLSSGIWNPVRTSQETHYFSVTEQSLLILCQIWGIHGGDHEECCLLGYKNPVRTSQETHYFSTTKPSRVLLCKIWGFHCGDYEECPLLGWTPCGFCRNARSVGSYRLHHQGWKESAILLLVNAKSFLAPRFLSTWWWWRNFPPIRRFLQEPHGVTSRKTAFFTRFRLEDII
jgi:hypothetical protein